MFLRPMSKTQKVQTVSLVVGGGGKDVTKPFKFKRFGGIHGPAPYTYCRQSIHFALLYALFRTKTWRRHGFVIGVQG